MWGVDCIQFFDEIDIIHPSRNHSRARLYYDEYLHMFTLTIFKTKVGSQNLTAVTYLRPTKYNFKKIRQWAALDYSISSKADAKPELKNLRWG